MNSNILFYDPLVGKVEKSLATIAQTRRGLLELEHNTREEARFPSWEVAGAIQIMIKTQMLRNNAGRQIGSMSSQRPSRSGTARCTKVRRQTHSTQAPKLNEPATRPLRRMSISQRKMKHNATATRSSLAPKPAEESKLPRPPVEAADVLPSNRHVLMATLRLPAKARPEGDVVSKHQRQNKALLFLKDYGNSMKGLYRQPHRPTASPLAPISEVSIESSLVPVPESSEHNTRRPMSGASTESSSPAVEIKAQTHKVTLIPLDLTATGPVNNDDTLSKPFLLPCKPSIIPVHAPTPSPTAAEKNGAATIRPQQRRRAEKKRRYTTPDDYIPSDHVSTFAATIERLAFEPIIKPGPTE